MVSQLPKARHHQAEMRMLRRATRLVRGAILGFLSVAALLAACLLLTSIVASALWSEGSWPGRIISGAEYTLDWPSSFFEVSAYFYVDWLDVTVWLPIHHEHVTQVTLPASFNVPGVLRSWHIIHPARPDGQALFIGSIKFRLSPALLLFSLYPGVVWYRGPFRRWRRSRMGLCVLCGYDLTGNVSGVCPECGAPEVDDKCGFPPRTLRKEAYSQ